jgi:hypothetical protein
MPPSFQTQVPPPELLAPYLFFPPKQEQQQAEATRVLDASTPTSPVVVAPPASASATAATPSATPPAKADTFEKQQPETKAPAGPVTPPPPPQGPQGKEKEAGAVPEEPPIAKSANPAFHPAPARGLDDTLIRNLNARLEDTDWQNRAQAANDITVLLESNPSLSRDPQAKSYIDAFMVKILRDPSTVVHEPALRAMIVGDYGAPPPEVLAELNRLRQGFGLGGIEPQLAAQALLALSQG